MADCLVFESPNSINEVILSCVYISVILMIVAMFHICESDYYNLNKYYLTISYQFKLLNRMVTLAWLKH